MTLVELGDEHSGATFGPGGADGSHRYRLHRKFPKDLFTRSGGTMLAVMLNPSTADHREVDPTVSGMMKRARMLGFAELCVVNLYAFRATDPKVMRRALRADRLLAIGPHNDEVIAAELARADVVVCGWGANADAERVAEFVTIAARVGALGKLHALRVLASGAPEHPLYIPHHLPPIPWSYG